MEINQLNESLGQKLIKILNANADNQFVQCPCRVTAVSENGNYVDVLPIINDDDDNQELYDVKIRHLESARAFIFLGVKKGDRGILRFFDRSIENYSINGSEEYNEDDRMHNDNDGLFELGFVPDNESYVYPSDKEIAIGLKNQKFTLSVDNAGNINILSQKDVNLFVSGNVTSTIQGNFLSKIEGNAEITVKGKVEETIESNLTATIKGKADLTVEQDVTASIKGNATANITGNANITATNINTNGILNHTGDMNVQGTMTAAQVIAQNGSTGTYANQVTTASGIVISGS